MKPTELRRAARAVVHRRALDRREARLSAAQAQSTTKQRKAMDEEARVGVNSRSDEMAVNYQLMDSAARLINLKRPELNAAAEHTSDGLFCITLSTPDLPPGAQWCFSIDDVFGTVYGNWGAGLVLADGELVENLETGLPGDCEDPQRTADAIVAALETRWN